MFDAHKIVHIFYCSSINEDFDLVADKIATFYSLGFAHDYCEYLDTIDCHYVALLDDGTRVFCD